MQRGWVREERGHGSLPGACRELPEDSILLLSPLLPAPFPAENPHPTLCSFLLLFSLLLSLSQEIGVTWLKENRSKMLPPAGRLWVMAREWSWGGSPPSLCAYKNSQLERSKEAVHSVGNNGCTWSVWEPWSSCLDPTNRERELEPHTFPQANWPRPSSQATSFYSIHWPTHPTPSLSTREVLI